MKFLPVLALVCMCLCSWGALSQDGVYVVDLKNPPPNTYQRQGSEKPLCAIGNEVEDSKFVKTTIGFNKKVDSPDPALAAHLALHNDTRIKVMQESGNLGLEGASRDTVKRFILGVASIAEVEGKAGTKVLRIEVSVDADMKGQGVRRASQHKQREVWEFDGKALKLIEQPKSWSLIIL